MNPLAVTVPVLATLAVSLGLAGGGPGRVVAPAPPVGSQADGPFPAVAIGAGAAPGGQAPAGGRPPPGGQARARGRWQWPLQPRPPVVRPFEPPASTWGRGHRGVDLDGAAGQPVLAVAAGTVAHVGVVAGRPTVSVLHPDGLRSTYEPVAASVAVGARVDAGAVVGTLAPVGSHCSPRACLHLGALRGRTYLDPLTLLRPTRVRLLPLWR